MLSWCIKTRRIPTRVMVQTKRTDNPWCRVNESQHMMSHKMRRISHSSQTISNLSRPESHLFLPPPSRTLLNLYTEFSNTSPCFAISYFACFYDSADFVD